jgi:uncharacterized protein YggE
MKPTLAALLLFASLPAAAFAQEGAGVRSVTADGEGRVEAEPDMARLHFGVSARRPTVAAARDEVARGVSGLIELARGLGVDEEDIGTAAVTVHPEYDWDPETRERRNLGYVVSRQVEIELQELSKLGEFTEKALALGVTEASPATLDSTRRSALESEALARATRDARDRAGVMAEALGARLGQPLRVNSVMRHSPPVPFARMAMAEADASGGAETYKPGLITVTASVTARFELLAGR